MAEVKYVGPTALLIGLNCQAFLASMLLFSYSDSYNTMHNVHPKQCQLPLTLMIVHTNCCPRQFLGPQPKQNNLSLSPWLLKKIKHFLTRYHQ